MIAAKEKKEYCLEDCMTLFKKRARERAGNKFNVKKIAKKVQRSISGQHTKCIYLGFNPASYKCDIVVLTEKGYEFIPLDEELTLVGGAWSSSTWLRLYYAQKNLSAFLSELGKALHTPVEDRCLYLKWLCESPDPLDEAGIANSYDLRRKEYALCREYQEKFFATYEKQITESEGAKTWADYHNKEFAYKYIPSLEIQKIINELYANRELFEEKDTWGSVKDMISVLNKLL